MARRGEATQSMMMSQDQMEELQAQIATLDANGDGYIDHCELSKAMEIAGHKLPQYRIRDIISNLDSDNDGKLSFAEFMQIHCNVTEENDTGRTFKNLVSRRENIETHGGMTSQSNEGTTHSVRKEEQVAFSNWINRNLADDEDCACYLPLNPDTRDLYNKCKDGILLCKMINKSQPGTIDERTINKPDKQWNVHTKRENLILALNSAQSIGCNIVNIGPDDLEKGKPHLVLGLLWQIIRIGLLSDINLHEHPGLAALLFDGESKEDLLKLSPEEILIRWVNYHLDKSPCGRNISNFKSDIKDSVAYIHLLSQIAPRDKGVLTVAENEPDDLKRAERMLLEADKIGCRSFVSPPEVVNGNYKLNLAFVANLFNMYPALDAPDDDDTEVVEETREERTYRNWMNSMGVSPYVNYLYSDLGDGLVIFQLYDIIIPGKVDWSKVAKKFRKLASLMEKIENCNYAVQLGHNCKFSLVGIQGKDIYDGNQTLTLALVWQLMKAYTLSILSKLATADGSPITERKIVEWVNERLKANGKKTSITGFNDPTISDGKVVIDLVDTIKDKSIKYELVKEGKTDEEKLDNAKFAISMARKIGARVYALPEDIVEVKQKMVMTVFACLMIRDHMPNKAS